MLLGREQTLCCADCIKLQAVQADRFLHVLQHVRAELPSFSEHLGLCPQVVGVTFRSWMVTMAACSCEQGGEDAWGAKATSKRKLGGGGPSGEAPEQFRAKIKCLRLGYF